MKNFAVIMLVASIMVISGIAFSLNAAPHTVNGTQVNNYVQTSSAYVGDVTIYANGTFTANAPLSKTGNTYSLTGNINGTLFDKRNLSQINGNGYLINGLGNMGFNSTDTGGVQVFNLVVNNTNVDVSLHKVHNMTLNNLTLLNFSTDGISLSHSVGVKVQNSNLSTVIGTATDAISVYRSSHIDVSGNDYLNSMSTGDFIYTIFSEYISAEYNTVSYASGGGNGVFLHSGSNANISYNTFNKVNTDLYAYAFFNVQSSNNVFNGTGTTGSSPAIEVLTSSGFSSVSDTAYNLPGWAGVFQHVQNITLKGEYFNNSANGLAFGYSSYIHIENSRIYNISNNPMNFVNGLDVNVSNTQFLNEHGTNDQISVSSVGGSIAFYNDAINVTGPYGFMLSSLANFSVTHSTLVSETSLFTASGLNDATIAYDSFTSLTSGTFIQVGGSNSNGLNIMNNTLTSRSPGSVGVTIGSIQASNVVISGNTFTNFSQGIQDTGPSTSNIMITGNTFYNTINAILSMNAAGVVISSNVLLDHNQTIISGYGIEAMSMAGSVTISGNSLEYNNTTGNLGISLFQSIGANIFGNTISNVHAGVQLLSNSRTSFFDNNITNTNYAFMSDGNNYLSVFDNVLKNASFDLLTSSGDSFVSVHGNTFNNSSKWVFMVFADNNVNFYHNNILNGTHVSVTDGLSPNLTWNLSLPVGGNYWSNYTGSGSNGIGVTPYNVTLNSKDYLPLTSKWVQHSVIFVETGLPSGTEWSAMLGSSKITSNTSDKSTIVFQPSNAQLLNLTYSISKVSGYVASTTSGTLLVGGSDRTVTVAFSPYTYTVAFRSTGLPSGTSWSVTLNGNTKTSASGQISFSEPNGTYSYTIGSVLGYHASSASGTVNVNSGAQSTSVGFVANTYTLTITETGLPAGQNWTVNVNGHSHKGMGSTVTFTLASGTYNVSVSAPSGYTVSVQPNVTVSGSNTSVSVTFSKVSTSGATLAAGIGIGLVVGAAAAALGLMFFTGTGVFRNYRKGKGGNP